MRRLNPNPSDYDRSHLERLFIKLGLDQPFLGSMTQGMDEKARSEQLVVRPANAESGFRSCGSFSSLSPAQLRRKVTGEASTRQVPAPASVHAATVPVPVVGRVEEGSTPFRISVWRGNDT